MPDSERVALLEAEPAAPAETTRDPTPARRPRCRGALVIGGDYRGLGVVRSLGRRGVPVWVLRDEHRIAATSRYARRSVTWPAGLCDEGDRVAYLLDLARRHDLDGWALFPTGDETAALVARYHDDLAARFVPSTPPWETIRWAYDKRLTHRLAAEAGVAYPWTAYPATRAAVVALDCAFPVILKPATRAASDPLTVAKAWRVDDRQELLARYDEARAALSPELIMVQELIPGGGEAQFSFAALCDEGRPVASIAARRARQYPMDFGKASTYVETIEEPAVEEAARRLLAHLRFTGLVEVEFKRDPRDGAFKLLDINARAWGWHSIGRRAGVDFPYLLWQLLQGATLPETRARAGVRWARMSQDLPTAAREIWHRQLTPAAYLRSLGGPLEFAIFAPDDPLPGLVEAPLLAWLALRRHAA